MSLCCSRSPIHHASRDDGSSLVVADARAERMVQSQAEPSWQEDSDIQTYKASAVFGTQQEAKPNSLVTMTGTSSFPTSCPIRPFPRHSDPGPLPARLGEVYAGLFAGSSLSKVPVPSGYISRLHIPVANQRLAVKYPRGSRMRESNTYGFVRWAHSDMPSYRDSHCTETYWSEKRVFVSPAK
jgi:hypothetical protein